VAGEQEVEWAEEHFAETFEDSGEREKQILMARVNILG
jgi:hypothetical protein